MSDLWLKIHCLDILNFKVLNLLPVRRRCTRLIYSLLRGTYLPDLQRRYLLPSCRPSQCNHIDRVRKYNVSESLCSPNLPSFSHNPSCISLGCTLWLNKIHRIELTIQYNIFYFIRCSFGCIYIWNFKIKLKHLNFQHHVIMRVKNNS